jgi:hypothetical protein
METVKTDPLPEPGSQEGSTISTLCALCQNFILDHARKMSFHLSGLISENTKLNAAFELLSKLCPGHILPEQEASPEDDDEEEELNGKIERLLIDLDPFIKYEDVKKKFVTYVVGENVKDTKITAYVNQIWEKGAFQDNMKKTDLWKVLHDAGVYKAGISNWNDQVEKPRHRK